uniref:AT-rich interactive domain-containing protein 3 n=1 Tax=Callorhinchus milii TaxID=7868 RepID=A0A4W3HTP3_CALMI
MKLQAVMENLQRQQRARLELEARQQHEMEQREGRSAGGAEPTHEQRLIAAQQTAALAAMRAAAALGMEPDGSPRLSESSEALSEEDEAAEEEEEMEGDEEEHFPDPMGSEEDMAAAEEEEQEEEDFEDEMAEEAVSRVKEEPGVQRSDQAPRLPGQRRLHSAIQFLLVLLRSNIQMYVTNHQATKIWIINMIWFYILPFLLQLYELDSDPRRKEFLDDLFTFMQKRGTPVNRIPIMAKQVLDLYMLYMLVTEKGGLVEVINKKLWREITKGLSLPTSITSAAFTLRTQYMKYLYPYECEKRGLSSPNELQVAIDSNRREGRRHSFGSSLFSYSPSGTPSALSSSKLQVPTLSLASNGSPIGHLTKIKKEDNVSIPLPLGGRLPISLSSQQVAAVQAAAAQAAVAAQAVALDQLREKLESGEPPEKRMAVGSDEQQRLMQRAIQQNLLAMTAQIPMNIRINSQDRQESALNLTTNGMSSISMSVEINGIVYTGNNKAPLSGVSSSKGNGNKTNSSQVPPGLSVPRTPTSSSSHTSNSSSP